MKNFKTEDLKLQDGVIKPEFGIVRYDYQKKLNTYKAVEKWYDSLKRLLDVLMSIVLLYFTFPIMVLFAVLIVIDSFGNPIYKQIRVGKNGKLITIYKLRSMKLNAEHNGAQWAEKDDPRITKVGKFIRKTRIDELPQLLNVLKGEMSFIGPRPERPEFVELFSSEIQGFEKRCLVTPGLTGLAQVKGGYDLSPEEKLKYDLKYIYKGNIFTEIYICLKTINIIITGSGSR